MSETAESPETATELPIVIEGSATKLARWGWWTLAAMGALTVGVVAMPDLAAEFEGEEEMLVFAILFFTACGGVMVWRARRGGPVLTADAAGVTIHGHRADIGPVRWDEIAAIEVRRLKGAQHLAFELYEPERTMERFGAAQSWSAKLAPFLGASPMVVPTTLFDDPPYRVRDRLEAVRKARVA